MDDSLAQKMRLLNRLADAILTAQQTFAVNPTHANAIAIQDLEKQRRDLQRTLPKLREVS